MAINWETIIHETPSEKTERLLVPGGWLVCRSSGFHFPQFTSMQFVADETHAWTIE